MRTVDMRNSGGTLSCSASSATLDEPMPGTAAHAVTWLCIEQPGPWGHNAPWQSHLDPELGRALSQRARASGIRLQLIRRPGRHADASSGQPRQVYLAYTHPRGSWLREASVKEMGQLLDLDFDAFALGEHQGFGSQTDGPILLVCTNGRRDRCCAVYGRALLNELGEPHDEGVWETTHTGGHRFAPAAVILPSGYTYGRLDGSTVRAAWSSAASGKVVLEQCRGRSTWTPSAQAAELAVRAHTHEYLVDALCAENITDTEVRVIHRDGHRWTVELSREELDPARPTSCATFPVRPTTYVVRNITKSC